MPMVARSWNYHWLYCTTEGSDITVYPKKSWK